MSNLLINTFAVNTDTAVIRLKGFIDSTNASRLRDSIEAFVLRNRYNIVIGFKEIEYISSAGWGVLIGKIRDIREHQGDIFLTGMIESVYSIYELMELDQIFKSFETIEEAIKILGKGRIDFKEIVSEKKQILPGIEREEYLVEKPPEEAGRLRSLEEDIKLIIAETPLISLKLLAEELGQREHGEWKVGWIQLKRTLKEMGFETVTERLYYAFKRAKEGK